VADKVTPLHKYKKAVVTIDVELWLESEKISVDYVKECADFLINAGKQRREDFKQQDGKTILQKIEYGQVKTYKYDN